MLEGCVEAPWATVTSARSARTCPTDGCGQDQGQGAWTGLVIQTRGVGADPYSQKGVKQRLEGIGHEDRQSTDQSKGIESRCRGRTRTFAVIGVWAANSR